MSVPADLRVVAFVRSALACLLERERWPVEGAGRVLLASTEALTNAIEHGSEEGSLVAVVLEVTSDRTDICVLDAGVPGVPVPVVPAHPPPHTAIRGRGLLIISRLADDVRLAQQGDGTRLEMGFLRATAEEAERRVERERRAA